MLLIAWLGCAQADRREPAMPAPSTTTPGTASPPGTSAPGTATPLDPAPVGVPTGLVSVAWSNAEDGFQALDLAVTTGGDVCVSGTVFPRTYTDVAFGGLLRIGGDGQVDAAHGTDGFVRRGSPYPLVATGPGDGCFTVGAPGLGGGYASGDDTLRLFTADGEHDPTFGVWSNGLDGIGGERILAVAGLADGGALVLRADAECAMAVVRLGPDGTPDPTFGSAGVADLPAPATQPMVRCDTGAIFALGTRALAVGGYPASVVALDSTGMLDASFGSAGIVASSGAFGVSAAAVDAGGTVWLGGSVTESGGQWPPVTSWLASYDAAGAIALPTTEIQVPGRFSVVDLAPRVGGGVVVAGRVTDEDAEYVALAWLDANALLDPTAPGAGFEIVLDEPGEPGAVGLARAGDGSIVCAVQNEGTTTIFAR
jgi:hypothetical protein